MPRTINRVLKPLVIMLAAVATFVASTFTAWAAADITITFVRHGESYGNTSCCINTVSPGPELTDTGLHQADLIGQALADDGIDYTSIYTSALTRTHQTAAPFADITGMTPTSLSGLNEVQAGALEGAPQNSGIMRIFYALIPLAWSLGLYGVPMPGSPDATGANFESRFNSAVKTMYQDGGADPVAFAHGMSIMAWTLMNVKNPDLSLMLKAPLSNTDTVTVTGNPTDGWTLVSWAGRAVTQNPGLLTKLMVNVRDVIAAPQMALFNIGQALRSGNITALADAVRSGVFNTLGAVVKFPINVVKSVVKSIATGTVFQGAKPPANVVVPPTGSQLGDSTGVPLAAANTAASTTTAPVVSTRRAAAAVKPVHADVAESTTASQKTDVTADSTDTATDTKADNGKSDKKSSTDTKRSDRKKDRHQGAGKAHVSAGSGSGKSGSSSGHHGGHK